jgi:hypothetical protein
MSLAALKRMERNVDRQIVLQATASSSATRASAIRVSDLLVSAFARMRSLLEWGGCRIEDRASRKGERMRSRSSQVEKTMCALLILCTGLGLSLSGGLAGCGDDEDNGTPLVADPGPDRTARPGDIVRLNGSRSRAPDGEPIEFHWRILQRPEGSRAELSDAGTVSPWFEVDALGQYDIELTVSWDARQSKPRTLLVTAAYDDSSLVPFRARAVNGCDDANPQPGAYSICVGGTDYPSPPLPAGETAGFHVLVLDRSSLDPTKTVNKSFPMTSASEMTDMQNFLAQQTSGNLLVVVSSLQSPSTIVPSSGWQNTMTLLGASQEIATLAQNDTYCLVGIPGLGVGNGFERLRAEVQGGPDKSSLDGYLTWDLQQKFRFTYPDFPGIETRAGGNSIIVGSQTFVSPPWYTNPGGGFQVLVLDRDDLTHEISNTLYETGYTPTPGHPDGGIIADELARMFGDLSALLTQTDKLVIIATVGSTPLGYGLAGFDVDNQYTRLQTIQLLGGTTAGFATLGPQHNYSLVTVPPGVTASSTAIRALGPGLSVEASTAKCDPEGDATKCTNLDGSVRGLLRRNNQGWYEPYLADGVGAAANIDYTLPGIAFGTPTPWVGPNGQGETLAYNWLSDCVWRTMFNQDLDDIRSMYDDKNVTWSTALTDLTGPNCAYEKSPMTFSNDDYVALQGQLITEFNYLSNMQNFFLSQLNSFLIKMQTEQTYGLESIYTSIQEEIGLASSSNQVTKKILSVVNAALMIASQLAKVVLVAPPAPAAGRQPLEAGVQATGAYAPALVLPQADAGSAVGPAMGVLAALVRLASDFIPSTKNGVSQETTGEIEEAVSNLWNEMGNQFITADFVRRKFYNLIVTDWGKLQTANANYHTWWNEDNTTILLQDMRTAFTVSIWQTLMPIVYEIEYMPGVGFTDPQCFCWNEGSSSRPSYYSQQAVPTESYQSFAMDPSRNDVYTVWSIHVSGTSGHSFPDDGSSKRVVDLADTIFGTGTDGLWVFKADFYSRWPWGTYSLPEDWSKQSHGCSWLKGKCPGY